MRRLSAGKGVSLVVLALLLAPLAVYAAPDRTGKWDVGVNVSGLLPDESDADNTVFVGGSLAYGLTEWLAVGAEIGWAETEIEERLSTGVIVNYGDLSTIPVLADLILRVPLKDSSFVPYGKVGLGAAFYDFDESALLTTNGISVDVDTSFAAKLGIGLDWFLNDDWVLNLEASHTFADADATYRTTSGVSATGEVDTDYWLIGGGLKYVF